MNDFPKDTGEWLAEAALEAAEGDYALANIRLNEARAVLDLWAMLDGEDNHG